MAGTYGYQQLFTEGVSAVTATPTVALGTRRIEGGCEYVYGYNAAATTASVGYGVIASLNSGFSFTVSAALGDTIVGVIKNADIPTVNYGWVCVRGVCHIAHTGDHVTAATGMGIYPVANGAFAAVTTGATGSTWVATKCGKTLETINTAATGAAYINCQW